LEAFSIYVGFLFPFAADDEIYGEIASRRKEVTISCTLIRASTPMSHPVREKAPSSNQPHDQAIMKSDEKSHKN
jgi:hypothetical protein